MLIIFFDIKEIVHKEFVLEGQTVYSAYYCDVLQRMRENMRKLRPLWQQKNWLLHHDNVSSNTSFFIGEFLTKNNMTVVPHPPNFSLFFQLKIKLKCRPFDTTEVIESELQMMLNTLTEHDFHNAFKKLQKCWEWCICMEGGYFGGDGGR
jgi:hypothetical protein